MKARSVILIFAVSMVMGLAGCEQGDGLPTNVETGMEAIQKNNYRNALTSFQSAIAEEEDLVSAYRGEGIAYMGLEDYGNAVASFDKALTEASDKMKDTIRDIRYYKASALYKQDDCIGTISVCDDILAVSSEADAYYLRGTCHLEQGNQDKAKVDFDAAVNLQPKDFDLYLNIYESYREQNLSAEGDQYLQAALGIESDENEGIYNKARVYYYLENYEQAQAELAQLVSAQNADALILMGKIYQAMGDYPHARNMYEQYISVYGETPTAYNGKALADIAEGSYDSALTNITSGLALEQSEGKQELYYNEIVTYEFKGDFPTAKEKALEYRTRYVTDELGKKEYEFLQTR